jgi:hypothetical protein
MAATSQTIASPTTVPPATLSLPAAWITALVLRAIAGVDRTLLPPLAKDIIQNSIKVDSITFEPGGAILFDGSLRRHVLIFRPGTDLKIKIVAKLMDARTIRLRVISATTGLTKQRDLKDTLLFGISEWLNANPQAAALVRFVDTPDDDYLEITVPVDYLPLAGLATDGNALTITAGVPVIETILSAWAATQLNTLKESGSLADSIAASHLQNPLPPVTGTGTKDVEIYPAPNVTGAVNIAKKF